MPASTATILDFATVRAQRQLQRRRAELARLRECQQARLAGLPLPQLPEVPPLQFRGVVALAR